MNRKPLFITLVLALAAIGIVAVVLFVKNKKAEPTPETKESGYIADEPENKYEQVKPAKSAAPVIINESLIQPSKYGDFTQE